MSRPLAFLHDPPGLLLVFIGGVLGTTARLNIEQLAPAQPGHFPLTTFGINLVGALVLGALLEYLASSRLDKELGRRLRLFGGTGICGGFTTYSTFADEQVLLIRDGHLPVALGYGVATLVVGAIGTVAGLVLGARLAARRDGVDSNRGRVIDPGFIDPDAPR